MALKEFDLAGKVAIVTGCGGGIGKGIALALAEGGADVVTVGRTKKLIEETAQEIQKMGRKSLAIPTDVTKADQVDKLVEQTLSKFKKIDILVNNVGTAKGKPLVPLTGEKDPMFGDILPPGFDTPTSEEDFRSVMDTNVTSIFLCCRAVVPHMLKQGKGKIINIGATSSLRLLAYQTVYAPSKAWVHQFTRNLAFELAKYKINVNTIAPGAYITPLTHALYEDENRVKKVLSTIPMGRVGDTKRDMGMTAVFLASEASDYVTGELISVDGGFNL